MKKVIGLLLLMSLKINSIIPAIPSCVPSLTISNLIEKRDTLDIELYHCHEKAEALTKVLEGFEVTTEKINTDLENVKSFLMLERQKIKNLELLYENIEDEIYDCTYQTQED